MWTNFLSIQLGGVQEVEINHESKRKSTCRKTNTQCINFNISVTLKAREMGQVRVEVIYLNPLMIFSWIFTFRGPLLLADKN